MNFNKLAQVLEETGQPDFRFKQIYEYYFKKPVKSWSDLSIVPKGLRDSFVGQVEFCSVAKIHHYETDDVVKFVFQMNDCGELVEAVVMKHIDGRRTLCLSCQAGCPMACSFCATGTMGLKKNLTEWEIVDMVREVNIFLSERGEAITNVVYMGMGEPFSNYLPVKQSIEILHDPKAFNLGWRKITVSTCGIVPKISEFAKDFPQANLAISLHAADNDKRTKLMPINKTYPLEKLMKACRQYVDETGRKLFFEYLVIDGFNDTDQDVENLKELLDHPLYHLNLIRFHVTSAVEKKYGVDWQAPSRASLKSFMDRLKKAGISLTLRRSFGEKIDAACGMLALKQKEKSEIK